MYACFSVLLPASEAEVEDEVLLELVCDRLPAALQKSKTSLLLPLGSEKLLS